jgi:formylglycine-generating enzyme required for sulfatase activity
VWQWFAVRPTGAAVVDGVARSLVGPLPYAAENPIDLPFFEGEALAAPARLVLDARRLVAGGKTVSAVDESLGRFILPPGRDPWNGPSVTAWKALGEQAGTPPEIAVDASARVEDLLRLAASVAAPGGSVRLVGLRVEGGKALELGQVDVGLPAAADAGGNAQHLRLWIGRQGADLWDGADRLAPIAGCEEGGPSICGAVEASSPALLLAARLEPVLKGARSDRGDAANSPVTLGAEPGLGVGAFLEAVTAVRRAGGKPVFSFDEQPCLHGWKGMACISGGDTRLGAAQDAKNPPRIVDIPTFYLDSREVTVGAYRACVDDRAFCPKPSGFPPRPASGTADSAPAEKLPVSGVSWEGAERFCAWSGKRLPTEWEWEKAARQPDGLAASTDCAAAWHAGCGATETTGAKPAPVKGPRPVGEGAANAWGLYDMSGNVAEWTGSWMGAAVGKSAVRTLLGPCGGAEPCAQATQRVVRGGSFASKTEELSASRRAAVSPAALKAAGIRCAVSGGAGDDPPPVLARGTDLHSPVLTKWPPALVSQPLADPGLPAVPTADELKIAHEVAEDDIEDKAVCAEEVVAAWNFASKKGGRSETTCRDPVSYPYSNEHKLVVYRRFAQNLGGGYVGVGADQNYDFMSLAKPRFAWLFDYDPNIVRLHRALQPLILAAETPEEFLAFFQPKNAEKGAQVIRDWYKARGDKGGEGYRYLFLRYQRLVGERYERKAVPRSDDPGFGWLSDPARYAVIRTLYQQDRVVILAGDMLADKAMQGIGAAARKLGLPIRIFYTSNAPTSWGGQITPGWRANVAALPFDDASVVLVTWNHGSFGGKDYWHYQVQRALTYQSRLQDPGYYHMFQLIWDRIPTDDADLTVIDLPSAP